MDKTINNKIYRVFENEFLEKKYTGLENLNILDSLGEFDRIVGLIKEISTLTYDSIFFSDLSHGGYMALNISDHFKNVFIKKNTHKENIETNITKYKVKNIFFGEDYCQSFVLVGKYNNSGVYNIILTTESLDLVSHRELVLTESNWRVYIIDDFYPIFFDHFKFYIHDNKLNYDNLIHFTAIVKNAGNDFERVLTENLPIIDRWTILDTGSTDNTKEIVKKVLSCKMGTLYEEPFINFRDSRNRCLDLAGKSCKFIIMLDDTYVVEGNLRNFLNICRGDQFSDSFSMFIQSDDMKYVSNRITKSEKNLRYIYTIHEVISPENNINVCIPDYISNIKDLKSDYMSSRTLNRKQQDIEMLFDEINKNPDDPRNYYYLAQTYSCINEYNKAYEYFIKRSCFPDHMGFIQEKIDALFEAARIADFRLKKDWKIAEKLYMNAWNLDKKRPDSLYFIGMKYYFDKNYKKSYEYIKKAFDLGFPIDSQYSLRPTVYYFYIPKYLTELSFINNEFGVGLKACDLFLKNTHIDSTLFTDEEINKIKEWKQILELLSLSKNIPLIKKYYGHPTICFIVDGGFFQWNGNNIETTGLGGSETFIVEIATNLKICYPYYNIIVFCNTEYIAPYKNVTYSPLKNIFEYISENIIEHCIISRYSEYLPLCQHISTIKNVYFSLHDVSPTGNILINTQNKLKKILCLTKWHQKLIQNKFPQFSDMITSLYYGIDSKSISEYLPKTPKIPLRFIYSSFPNRGLLQLLHIWKKIQEKYPTASLDLFVDTKNHWVQKYYSSVMDQIENFLENNKHLNIKNYGWVDKKTLYKHWAMADFWLYPCIFAETFCLTALEAAASKTMAITTDLAGLNETVSDRGIMIEGDPNEKIWHDKVLDVIDDLIQNPHKKEEYIERNYTWALNSSWRFRTISLVEKILKPHENIIEEYKYSLKTIQEKFNITHQDSLQIGKEVDFVLTSDTIFHCEDLRKELDQKNKKNNKYKFIYLNNNPTIVKMILPFIKEYTQYIITNNFNLLPEYLLQNNYKILHSDYIVLFE